MLTNAGGDPLALLACPVCHGELTRSDPGLSCAACPRQFPVMEGVPVLLPWTGGSAGAEWADWERKLELLQQWRRSTWDGSPRSEDRQKLADDLTREFFRFARIPQKGPVLEIGCGTGELRRHVPRRLYFGLDPLAGMPGVAGAALPDPAEASAVFLRGVGERLPLADESFESVIICETLDHSLDPDRVIREAHRVLRPDGVLAVMQNVRLEMPAPGLLVRLRAALGRLRSRAARGEGVADIDTKMHVMGQDDLGALVNRYLTAEAGITSGSVMFLRALKQDPSAPRVPKRTV